MNRLHMTLHPERHTVAMAFLMFAVSLAAPPAALATVSVSRAEFDGGRLRLEGGAIANQAITVESVAFGQADGNGEFRIERSGYTPPADCTIDVNDGSATPTSARLSGCTVASTPPPPPPPPSTGAVPPTSFSLSHSTLDQVGTLAVGAVSFAPNPPTPLDFTIASSHPGNASVPASVHVENFADPANPVASFTVTYTSVVSVATPVTISVSAAGVTLSASLTLNPPPTPTLGSGERGPGFVGSDFATFATKGSTISFSPSGTGVGPLKASITAGRLPDGLRLVQPNCATPAKCPWVFISGTPKKAQTNTFTVSATDARGVRATGTFTITINAARPLTIAPQPWAPLTVGSFGNLWIDGDGGTRPYRWTLIAGVFPPGMSLIQDDPAGALVRVGGTPTSAGTFGFTLRLTDATGATASRAFTVAVS